MANQNVETVTNGADRFKVALAVAIVVAGVVGFYMLAGQPTVIRVASVLGGLILGAVVGYMSGPGQRFFAFLQDAWSETRRVVWPTRKETTQMTLIVFGFVILMAIFLWLVDQGVSWILYDLLLGWR